MSLDQASIYAGIMHWRRQLQREFVNICVPQEAQAGHDPVTMETWQRFEQHELRESIVTTTSMMKITLSLCLLINLFAFSTSNFGVAVAGAELMAGLALYAWTMYVAKWCSSASKDPAQEWRTYVIYQSSVISAFFYWALASGTCRSNRQEASGNRQ